MLTLALLVMLMIAADWPLIAACLALLRDFINVMQEGT